MTEVSSHIKTKVRALSSKPGVYIMRDRIGTVLYVGKAKNLKNRVSTYFQASRKNQLQYQPKVKRMIDLVHDFDIIEVRSESEALLLEGKLIKEYKPKYNTDFTDDKRFILIRVEMKKVLPRFTLVRNRIDDGSRYFGPFAHSAMVKSTLHEMRVKFGILLQDAKPVQVSKGMYRLYDDARSEIFKEEGEISIESYGERVEKACEFLEGKAKDWIQEVEEKMKKHAELKQYEKAAEMRDLLQSMKETIEPTRKFRSTPIPKFLAKNGGVKALQEALGMKQEPATIECFDISHISGEFVVASMVRFKDGSPDKKQYRRFKIRSFVGNDDFRAMAEVVGRRYGRLFREEKPFPDLVVIDGGIGQVNSALMAFEAEGLPVPELIGLAKREETIVFPEGKESLLLDRRDEGLRLLQRLRDEAHRFANSFNAELRSKRLRESVLDDFSGIGKVKKQSILKHFKSIQNLKSASVQAITEVDGIGPKTAERLYEFLRE